MAKFGDRRYAGVDKDGNQKFLAGVPARDLSGEEWEALPAELREHAETLGLYEVVSARSPARSERAESRPAPPVEKTEPAAPGEGGG